MKIVSIASLVLVAMTTATAAVGPGPTRDVTYVPSIVSVPSNPTWGSPLTYVIEIRSRAPVNSVVSAGMLLYLSSAVGEASTTVGVYHRTVKIPKHGTAALRFTATAPPEPTGRGLCLGVTVGGDSSGAFVCTPVG